LHFEYMVSKDNLSALVSSFASGTLKGAQRFHLKVKTDTDTVLAILVQEKNGGRFSAVAAVPKNLWQDIDFSPSELTLGRDKDDPKDANGVLDVDQIETVSLLDLHTFFIRNEAPELKALFPAITAGPRELWL
ncbi:hypothetical protein N4Q63_27605, partial [Leclercia adecarboxylata]|uniref:hypothetical protein n=1 Tax=Leclercia adecarboxylata TaxID=83655 RepID=UPI00234DAB87|nr:hypothetical protein [Leclercia adecarboxylata]